MRGTGTIIRAGAAALLVGVLVPSHGAARPAARAGPDPACAARARPPLYRIDLKPTGPVTGARGVALLRPASTLFGVSVTADGHHRFAVQVRVRDLPEPSTLGAYAAYVVWAAPSDLSSVRRVGALGADGTARGELSFEKFLVFVTAEPTADATARSGPIVLQGLSPSGQMKNMLTEPLLNGGMPPC
ncbi:MAG TPA: hypothetical protein VKA44_01805 [Gemmatimonadota bacterium]|nr:hypothetical protein [Gemmatimonadota bacterium]